VINILIIKAKQSNLGTLEAQDDTQVEVTSNKQEIYYGNGFGSEDTHKSTTILARYLIPLYM
jgi:hypothetical protein